MPRDSTDKCKRKPVVSLPVPTDPGERKRVLNVLAQRRYRQRRREHVRNLESHRDHAVEGRSSQPIQHNSRDPPPNSQGTSGDPTPGPLHNLLIEGDTSGCGDFTDSAYLQSTRSQDGLEANETGGNLDDALELCALDPSFAFPSLSSSPLLSCCPLSVSPQSQSTPTASSDDATDATSTSWPMEFRDSSAEQALRHMNSPPSAPYSFADDAYLEVFPLSVLRGCMAIASRLQIPADEIWSITGGSPFADPAKAYFSYEHLPLSLRPTPTQRRIPHHPMLDLLPWPAVRSRLILMFAQPLELRPTAAASDLGLLNLQHDADDGAEGLKVWGQDPCECRNWEVGEKVYHNWWWAFEPEIVKRSNELRRRRGAPLLGSGTILGEVL